MNKITLRVFFIFLLFIFCLFTDGLSAQMQQNVWYFGGIDSDAGTGEGINFNTSPPSLIPTSAMGAGEGCASVADRSTGALLFYTNGMTIYNKNHQVMLNGDSLKGHWSATQSALIIPRPYSDNQYYVFSNFAQANYPAFGLGSKGIVYSIVDLALDSGLGAVIPSQKNIPIPGTINVAEKLTAIKNSGGDEYWLIFHEFLPANIAAPAQQTSKFRVCLVTGSGVNIPQDFNAGSYYVSRRNDAGQGTKTSIGYLKPSHDCKLLAAVVNEQDKVDILNFSNVTGAVSSNYSFSVRDSNLYGVEFSPDNSKLYVSSCYGKTTGGLYQFDLSSGNPSTIAASKKTLLSFTLTTQTGGGALQLAPDGKIYFARTPNAGGLSYLGTINSPDSLAPACNFVEQGFMLGTKFSSMGLPNFPQEGCSDSLTSGIAEASKQHEPSIYPNPFSRETTLKVNSVLKSASLIVYNCMSSN